MSIGGFRAIVKIDHYEFARGYHKGEPYISADMELEGFLVDFTFGKPQKEWSPHGKEIKVSLNIKFTQQQEEIDYRHWCGEQDKNEKYIGTIRAKPGDRWASVEITLPYDMFFQIWPLRERDIIFDTIHDLITEPNEDSVVALIQRVYFTERRWGYEQHSPTKRWHVLPVICGLVGALLGGYLGLVTRPLGAGETWAWIACVIAAVLGGFLGEKVGSMIVAALSRWEVTL